jgi:hypothetical protein
MISPMRDDGAPLQASLLRCMNCSRDLTGATIGGRCPQCGRAVEDSLWPTGCDDGSDAARTAAAMAVASLLFCPFPAAGLLFGLLACGLFALACRESASAVRPSPVRWSWVAVAVVALGINLVILALMMA